MQVVGNEWRRRGRGEARLLVKKKKGKQGGKCQGGEEVEHRRRSTNLSGLKSNLFFFGIAPFPLHGT